MHNAKIAIAQASSTKWCEGCLVISEIDAQTIWVLQADRLQSPLMRRSANIANEAIGRMTESVV